jgi:hypothetical protein
MKTTRDVLRDSLIDSEISIPENSTERDVARVFSQIISEVSGDNYTTRDIYRNWAQISSLTTLRDALYSFIISDAIVSYESNQIEFNGDVILFSPNGLPERKQSARDLMIVASEKVKSILDGLMMFQSEPITFNGEFVYYNP